MSESVSGHASAAADRSNVAAPAPIEQVREALREGPRGALVLASTTTALLLIGWLLFYFVLFVPLGLAE